MWQLIFWVLLESKSFSSVLLALLFLHPYKAMAPHSSTLAWKIPRTEEPGRLQSMGSLRVGHDWVTSLSLFTLMHWRRKWQPTPVFLPGESQGWGSLVGCCLWVAQSWTQLKRLSSSSRNNPYQILAGSKGLEERQKTHCLLIKHLFSTNCMLGLHWSLEDRGQTSLWTFKVSLSLLAPVSHSSCLLHLPVHFAGYTDTQILQYGIQHFTFSNRILHRMWWS